MKLGFFIAWLPIVLSIFSIISSVFGINNEENDVPCSRKLAIAAIICFVIGVFFSFFANNFFKIVSISLCIIGYILCIVSMWKDERRRFILGIVIFPLIISAVLAVFSTEKKEYGPVQLRQSSAVSDSNEIETKITED